MVKWDIPNGKRYDNYNYTTGVLINRVNRIDTK